MSPHERASILYLIDSLPQRKVAVEIGSYAGGFLRQLVKHFDVVHSIDLTHNHLTKTDYNPASVVFHTGDSTKILPTLVPTLSDVTFFLIDANHEYPFVRKDLAAVLSYVPTAPTYVLIHDSWYMPSRRAILDTCLLLSEPAKETKHTTCLPNHVHFIDLDFASGEWANGQWMGGLALLSLLPQERTGPLEVVQSRRKCPYYPPT